jgi:hypothetical protein
LKKGIFVDVIKFGRPEAGFLKQRVPELRIKNCKSQVVSCAQKYFCYL